MEKKPIPGKFEGAKARSKQVLILLTITLCTTISICQPPQLVSAFNATFHNASAALTLAPSTFAILLMR